MAEKIPGSDSNIPAVGSQGQIIVPSDTGQTFEEKVNAIIDKKLQDPTLFPAEYRSWLPRYIEGQNIQLPVSQVIGASAPRIVGEFVLWGGAAAAGFTGELEVQTGYLYANGAEVSRLRWPQLFESYGTKYGIGDGSNTFALPNLIGRVLVARAESGTFLTTGATGGAESHTHSLAHTHNLASHTHTGPSHTHTMGSHTHTGSAHTHDLANHSHTLSLDTGQSSDSGLDVPAGSGNLRQRQAHVHSVSGNTGFPSSNTSGSGGGGATGGPSTNSTDAGGTGATGAPSTNTSGAASNETTSSVSTLPPFVVVEAWLIYAGVKVTQLA
jgi:microcystin-dependent protein